MDFRTRLQLDGSDFSSTLDSAGKSVNDFSKQTQDASKQVDDLGKSTKKTARELLNEMKGMENLGRSTSGYRSQLAQMTRDIQDLTINFNQMSNEMKNSDFGREVASQIQELTQRAADMRDQVMDAAASVKLLSSDTANLDAAKSAIEGLSAGFQLVASAGILGEESTEKVVKALAKLKAIESATNAVIKISNILNKDSILMLKLKDLWTKLHTAAQMKNTAAIKGATVAQKAFNTAAKKNIYVILISAIIAATAALIKYNKAAQESKKRQEELAKETERAKQNYEDYKSAVVSAASSLVGKFRELQTQYTALRTEAEKEEWLKKNKKAFEDLGLSVQTVNDAEKIMVDQADEVIAALTARAQAAGAYSMITTKSNQVLEAQLDKEQALLEARGKIHEGTTIWTSGNAFGSSIPDYLQAAGVTADDLEFKLGGGQSGAGWWTVTARAAQKYYNYITSQQDKIIAQRQQELELAQKLAQENEAVAQDAENRLKENGINPPGGSGGSGNPDVPNYQKGSLAWYDAQIKALQDLIQNQRLSKEQLEDINKQIEQLESDKLAYIQRLRGGSIELIPELKMIGTDKALEDLQKYYEEHPLQIKGEVTTDGEQYTMHDSYSAANNILGSINSINSGIDGIYNRWSKFTENIEDKNPFETMLYSIDSLISTMQTIVSIMDTINGLQELFNKLGWIGVGAKEAEVGAETAGLGPKAASVELSQEEAVANAAAAAGAVGESAGKIPYVGWILAIAAVAGIIAAIASAKSSIGFAKGGIVPGSSFSGDNISAQLNSGEMVLTTGQQSRLFDLLNGSGSINGGSNKVEFVIKGQELKGVLNNYDKKMSRI